MKNLKVNQFIFKKQFILTLIERKPIVFKDSFMLIQKHYFSKRLNENLLMVKSQHKAFSSPEKSLPKKSKKTTTPPQNKEKETNTNKESIKDEQHPNNTQEKPTKIEVKAVNNPKDMSYSYLKTLITQHKFHGKVDNDRLVLEEKLASLISNNSHNDFYTVFLSGQNFIKLLIIKLILGLTGVSLLLVLYYLKPWFLKSNWLKVPLALVGVGVLAVSLINSNYQVFSFIKQICINKNLQTVKFVLFPKREFVVPIENIYLNYFNNDPFKTILLINKKYYLVFFQNSLVFDKDLLPLVIRGYNLKYPGKAGI